MNALFLKDLALKTKRGLQGRIGKGRSAGVMNMVMMLLESMVLTVQSTAEGGQ